MHKHNNSGQTLQLQSVVVTLYMYIRWSCSSKLTLFRLKTMYLWKFGGDPPAGSEDRAQKRLIEQFFG